MLNKMAIILAAGKGTRMKSDLPKVLVPVCGRPMIEYVVDALLDCGVDSLEVVVGYRRELVEQTLAARPRTRFVPQTEQLGTGHAVMMCREAIAAHEGAVLIVAGDSPCIQRDSIRRLLEEFDRTRPACLMGTAHKTNPAGLGRIVRDAQGNFDRIVEEKDATEEQRRITEVNMSTYLFNAGDLLEALGNLKANNRQGEYYLTDCPGILKGMGRTVQALDVLKPIEALSINTMDELQEVETAMREAGLAR
jgi:bifunctional UDP-N-acetylglucosamine pyrophosphorylase/glucosamine-1-phosphate N-acetyltransferase/UDP-N-acetylglucosamine pyrophosphorylase